MLPFSYGKYRGGEVDKICWRDASSLLDVDNILWAIIPELTLYDPRWLTWQDRIASLPATTVLFSTTSVNSGSLSSLAPPVTCLLVSVIQDKQVLMHLQIDKCNSVLYMNKNKVFRRIRHQCASYDLEAVSQFVHVEQSCRTEVPVGSIWVFL